MRDSLLQRLFANHASGVHLARLRASPPVLSERFASARTLSRSDRALRQALDRHIRQWAELAVLLVRIERTETLREAFGSEVVETVLDRCRERLEQESGDEAHVVAGEDGEILILVAGLDGLSGQRYMERLLGWLQRPIDVAGLCIAPRVAIGAAYAPVHGDEAATLIRRARIARGEARDRFVPVTCYEPGSEERWAGQLALLAELRHAFDRDELELHYQPKIRARPCAAGKPCTVVGVEALVRWRHPDRGLIPPDRFIPLAETSGVIVELGERVLSLAVAQLACWRAAGIDLEMSVNLSARDLESPGLLPRITRRLADANVPAHALMIEVTESATMRDPALACAALQQLRSTGLRISLDDFGTGQSSLAKLRDLPVDELKIDRAFVTHLEPDSLEQAIVHAIIDLGHAAGCTVVVEGVETEAQLALLDTLGADLIQGWAIAPAMTIDAFEAWLEARNVLVAGDSSVDRAVPPGSDLEEIPRAA